MQTWWMRPQWKGSLHVSPWNPRNSHRPTDPNPGELCFPQEKWEAQWPEWQSRVPQPSPTPLLSASELQWEDTVAPLTQQPAATATGHSTDSQLSKSLLPCKTNTEITGKVTRKWESCQAVTSQSNRKWKPDSLDICSYNSVHLPH